MANPSYLCQQLFRSERLQQGQELVWCSKRLRRDVAAELRAIEVDFFHGGVGGGLRGFQIPGVAASRQSAAIWKTIGEFAAVCRHAATAHIAFYRDIAAEMRAFDAPRRLARLSKHCPKPSDLMS